MSSRFVGFIGALLIVGFLIEVIDNFTRDGAWSLVFIILFGMFLQNMYPLSFINQAIDNYNRLMGNA